MINCNYVISSSTTMMEALRVMDSEQRKLLIIADESQFKGVISIGDIQRAILHKDNLQGNVIDYVRDDILYAKTGDSIESIKRLMYKDRIECMPVVDESGCLVEIIEWEELFNSEAKVNKLVQNYPVVIMAGGKGTRLYPITNVIPKPLVPISDKTIIETIIERFQKYGCDEFYISIGYRGEEIKEFFEKKSERKYKISYVEENKPLGTAGAIANLTGINEENFFVTNCDILVDVDLSELMEYHKSNNNLLTLVSVLISNRLPYGVLETGKNGQLIEIIEKPEILHQINSGVYVVNRSILKYMKCGEKTDITDLIEILKQNGENIGVFPIQESGWKDMGNWESYIQMVKR